MSAQALIRRTADYRRWRKISLRHLRIKIPLWKNVSFPNIWRHVSWKRKADAGLFPRFATLVCRFANGESLEQCCQKLFNLAETQCNVALRFRNQQKAEARLFLVSASD